MDKRELILHLISEQIRNQILINALENLGFDCTTYTLNISGVIFALVDFKKKKDDLYQWYFNQIDESIKEITYCNINEMMIKWSELIYFDLIDKKSNESFLSK